MLFPGGGTDFWVDDETKTDYNEYFKCNLQIITFSWKLHNLKGYLI